VQQYEVHQRYNQTKEYSQLLPIIAFTYKIQTGLRFRNIVRRVRKVRLLRASIKLFPSPRHPYLDWEGLKLKGKGYQPSNPPAEDKTDQKPGLDKVKLASGDLFRRLEEAQPLLLEIDYEKEQRSYLLSSPHTVPSIISPPVEAGDRASNTPPNQNNSRAIPKTPSHPQPSQEDQAP
jgi:hypothetical protein